MGPTKAERKKGAKIYHVANERELAQGNQRIVEAMRREGLKRGKNHRMEERHRTWWDVGRLSRWSVLIVKEPPRDAEKLQGKKIRLA